MMKKMPGIVLCLSLAMWIVGNAVDALAAKPVKSVQETLQEQQDMMVRECKLSEQQQKTVKEKFVPKQKALEAWDQANAEKLKSAQDAAGSARKGTDDAAKKKATGDLRALENDRVQAAAEADKAILAILSAEQQIVWAGVQMAEATLPRYKKANLTEDQAAKVKGCCMIAAKDLAAYSGDDKKDKQGRSTVQKCLKWAIDNVILTPEQRETVAKKPAKK